MKKYGIKPYRRICRKPVKKDDLGKPPVHYPNLIKNLCPIKPNVIWVTDFTYIKFQDRFIYLATIMDLYTREIVGFNVSSYHNKELVTQALKHALSKTGKIPIIIHSDQGSEYDSEAFINLARLYGLPFLEVNLSCGILITSNGRRLTYKSVCPMTHRTRTTLLVNRYFTNILKGWVGVSNLPDLQQIGNRHNPIPPFWYINKN